MSPRVYDEALWRSLYKAHMPGLPVVTYGREWVKRFSVRNSMQDALEITFGKKRDGLVGLGANTNADILFIGAAFGFTMELLIDFGFANVYGIDNSPFIHQNMATEARSDVASRIIDADVTDPNLSSVLSSAGFPTTYTWVVDEDCITSFTDAEIPSMITACEDLLKGGAHGRIIHVVSPIKDAPGDSAINWKTMQEWKLYAPTHTWVDAREMEVVQ